MINGNSLLNAIISGTNNITKNKDLVDKLNIFPVPDGDTGTNMSMTMMAASKALKECESDLPVGKIAEIAASSLLRGARGNSGTILSLLFRGFARGISEFENASGRDIVSALSLGVDAAYKAVMNPAEGTMLTVARVAYETGRNAATISNDPVYVWEEICKGAEAALKTTPELLPVLKKAGVVDAGGKGLCLIFEGMMSVFRDGTIIENELEQKTSSAKIFDNEFNNVISEFDEEINFTYCTELLVERNTSISTDPQELRSYLETIGDCAVVVNDDEIIKVHVHTENPGLVLQEALKYGELIKVKVENMKEQNKNIKKQEAKSLQKEKLKPAEPTEEVGFVAIAAGNGIQKLFKDLGCLNVVGGGQTMNPSVEDILEAIMATPAKNVFVLPNNKNIILAAEQSVSLATDRNVIVVPSKTIPQGLSAMLSYNPDLSIKDNFSLIMENIANVQSGQVTFAARNSEYGGFKIKKNDILAFKDRKLIHKHSDPVKSVIKLVGSMVKKGTSFITLIYGHEITQEQAEIAFTHIQNKYGSHIDVTLINGEQPLDYFIVSVE